ncbi:MAG: hypothetical protein K2X27_26445 [Candidatus Obscuribacterales bacterium]|nr:hypothetical protein [Candidatus Obscuribacterales bacterium]
MRTGRSDLLNDAACGKESWFSRNVTETAKESLIHDIFHPLENAALILQGKSADRKEKNQADLSNAPASAGDYLTQLAVAGIISAGTYSICGRLTGGIMRQTARNLGLKGAAARMSSSEMSSQILGAAAHDYLLDAPDQKHRNANLVSGILAFSTYECLNRKITAKPALSRFLWQLPIGASGASVSFLGRETLSGENFDAESLKTAALSGAALNLMLPGAQFISGKILDHGNLALGRGVPLERYFKYLNLDNKSSTLDALKNEFFLSRVQNHPYEYATINHRSGIIKTKNNESSEMIAHELGHLKALKNSESGFARAKELLSINEPLARMIYLGSRIQQENYAHNVEMQVAKELKSTGRCAEKISSNAQLKAAPEQSYLALFESEFQTFKAHAGNWRPEDDFGHLGRGMDLEAFRHKDDPAEFIPQLYDVLTEQEQKAMISALSVWKSKDLTNNSAFDLIYGLEPKAIRQAFAWSRIYNIAFTHFAEANKEIQPEDTNKHRSEFPQLSAFCKTQKENLEQARRHRSSLKSESQTMLTNDSASALKRLEDACSLISKIRDCNTQIKPSEKSRITASEVSSLEAKLNLRLKNLRESLPEILAEHQRQEAVEENEFASSFQTKLQSINEMFMPQLDALKSKFSLKIAPYKLQLEERLNTLDADFGKELGPLKKYFSSDGEWKIAPELQGQCEMLLSKARSEYNEKRQKYQDEYEWSISNYKKDYAYASAALRFQLNQAREPLLRKMCTEQTLRRAEREAERQNLERVQNFAIERIKLQLKAIPGALERLASTSRENDAKGISIGDSWLNLRKSAFEKSFQKLQQEKQNFDEQADFQFSSCKRRLASKFLNAAEQELKDSRRADEAQAYSDKEAEQALATALTFGNRSALWLGKRATEMIISESSKIIEIPLQKNLRRSGLAEVLLKNSDKATEDLNQICKHWQNIGELSQEDRAQSAEFTSLLNLAKGRQFYPAAQVAALAAEASQWSISKASYRKAERSYLNSLKINEPFPTDKIWKDANLTARFLPRSDVRRLFMGNHTRSCMRIGGANEQGICWVQNSERAGIFVIENTKDKQIIAASRAWVAADLESVCFNSIQSKGAAGRDLQILKLYKQAADHLIKDQGIKLVIVGEEHSKVDISSLPRATDLIPLPHGLKGLNDCAQAQRIIAIAEKE